MTPSNEVKRILLELKQTALIKQLVRDTAFHATVAEQYDEYTRESEEESNWDLEQYVLDKIEWEEE